MLRSLGIFVCFWLYAICAFSQTLTPYQFNVPKFVTPANAMPKSVYAGEVRLAQGGQLPAYRLTVTSGGEEDWETSSVKMPDVLLVKLAPEVVPALMLVAGPHGWLLVPKGWRAFRGAAGANGSAALLFAPDKSGREYLTYYGSGPCVGCALTEASLFFDAARAEAKKSDFTYYTSSKPAMKAIKLRPTHVAYEFSFGEGYGVNGLAIYDPNEEGNLFSNIEVRVDTQNRKLASAVLNWFVPAKMSRQ